MQIIQSCFLRPWIVTGLLVTGFCLAMTSCQPGEDREGVLIIRGTETSPLPDDDNMKIHVTADLAYLSEDSLQLYQQLILTGFSVDSLTAAHQRNIERFVSRGGQLYLHQLQMNYQRQWPLAERLILKTRRTTDEPKNLLAARQSEVPYVNYGNGSVFSLTDARWSGSEIAAFLQQKQDTQTWLTASSLPSYPDPQRFTYTTLFSGLKEPTEFEVLPNRDILLVERGGAVKYYDQQLDEIKTIAQLAVNYTQSNGLNGLALYPDFRQKPWVFLSYSHVSEPFQYISRFYLAGDSLIMNSEKVIMKVPHKPEDANHASNALEFDAAGNLYIGFGDYTWQPEGYAPLDERPGELRRDAQRTAGNANNPLGGILRIHPEEDGTYSIPEGNLYPKSDSLSLAEIFVQGCRNPYRFSVDPETQYLFFGDVGPDATVDSERGTQGYEEINLAREAGFFGWPYFVANNLAYPDFDYATEKVGDLFDPAAPVNNSPNNTGLRELPPARPAILWYPREPTTEFPGMGQGGMNIMVGPVFHSALYPFAKDKLPDYFDGKLLFYDWVRGWVKTATLDEDYRVVQVEPFLDTLHFAHPMDMRFGPDGALYVLDYGSQGYAKNLDAKLVRISYPRGNRQPVARIRASETVGAAPFEVTLSATDSYDADGDSLMFTWEIDEKRLPGKVLVYRFEEVGEHEVRLIVEDSQGATDEASILISVGNTPSEIRLITQGNRSFYWDSLAYRVEVQDPEDGSLSAGQIPAGDVKLRLTYQPSAVLSNPSGNIHDLWDGKQLVLENGCVACHNADTRSLGPSYTEVALRYRDQEKRDMLAQKILQGGEGNWNMGRAMPAHPFLEEAEIKKMVSYILSLANQPQTEKVGTSGVLVFDQSQEENTGKYRLEISYEDQRVEKVGAIRSSKKYTFRSPRLLANEADYWRGVAQRVNGIALVQENEAYLRYQDIDLRQINRIGVRLKTLVAGTLEVRLNAADGPIVGKVEVDENPEWHEVEASLQQTTTQQDLYFVFRTGQPDLSSNFFILDTFYFRRAAPAL